MTHEWMEFETAFLGSLLSLIRKQIIGRRPSIPPKVRPYECGAQDQGNELSVLLNEVGAQSFMDVKDKEKDKEEGGGTGRDRLGSAHFIVSFMQQSFSANVINHLINLREEGLVV